MALQLKLDKNYGPQEAITDVHKLLLITKQSHYKTRSYAQHGAFDRAFDALTDLADKISEQLIGYSEHDVAPFEIGTVHPLALKDFGNVIIDIAKKIKDLGTAKGYENIENLAQELSGVGALMKYLYRFP